MINLQAQWPYLLSSLPHTEKGDIFIVVTLSQSARTLSYIRLFVTPWTVAREAPLSMGFPRHEYWSGLPFSPPGDLPSPGIEPPLSPALAGRFFTTAPHSCCTILYVTGVQYSDSQFLNTILHL